MLATQRGAGSALAEPLANFAIAPGWSAASEDWNAPSASASAVVDNVAAGSQHAGFAMQVLQPPCLACLVCCPRQCKAALAAVSSQLVFFVMITIVSPVVVGVIFIIACTKGAGCCLQPCLQTAHPGFQCKAGRQLPAHSDHACAGPGLR